MSFQEVGFCFSCSDVETRITVVNNRFFAIPPNAIQILMPPLVLYPMVLKISIVTDLDVFQKCKPSRSQ